MTEQEMRDLARFQAEENARVARLSGAGGVDDGSPAFKKAKAEAEELANSFANLAGNLNLGYQGMSVYNASISQGAATFGSVLSALGPLGTAFKALGVGVGEYAILVNKQTDALYKSYQEISSVGAGGKEGLQGVFNTMQQFGLGVAQLAQFNAMVKENSTTLAAFGGSTKSGLAAFANLAEGVKRTGLETELMNLGISEEAQRKGLGNFLKTTVQLGDSQRVLSMTTQQQAQAAADYIKQQDLVTRLTGATAEQQQKTLEAAMSNERFAADQIIKQQEIARLEAAGQTEAAAALRQQTTDNLAIIESLPAGLRKGMQDMMSDAGALTEEGRKLYNAIGDEGRRALQDQNLSLQDKMAIIQKNMLQSAQDNAQLIRAAGPQEFLANINEMYQVGTKTVPKVDQTKKDQTDQAAGKVELTLANYNAMIQEQVDITRKFQNTIQLGMQPLSTAMVKASDVIGAMTKIIPGSSGIARTGTQAYITEKENKERGETTGLELRQKFETVLDRDQAAAIRTDIKNDLKAVGDTYHDFLNTLKNRMEEWKNDIIKLNPFKTPLSAAPAAAESVQMLSSAITRQSMDSMLAMARLGGPVNNYSPALTDAVYTPLANREQENTRYSAVSDTASQYNREQTIAFNDMAGKLDDMITLMQRSVGIQGDTLRATYSQA